jgi:UDP-GlcNAc:undecaprenyl-phosphate GlcNAc-1-phosphate transferase
VDVIIMGFVTSFFVVLLATPSLIKVAKLKHLVDEPGEERKLHRRSVPTIGGIIIFSAILFSYSLWFPEGQGGFNEFKYLTASLVILFFVGVKDDIIGTAPVKKLLAHIIVAFILVMMAQVKITGMHGLFGMEAVMGWPSVMLSVFVYIVVVNAFNLIDGVDGLAAGIGFINTLFFGIWFQLAGNVPLALLAFILAGALLAFLMFNFSPAKIFMGDSGSLTIGVIISVLAIKMIENPTVLMPVELQAVPTPVFAMSVLVYPLLDTLRIFIVRAVKGQSPFAADKNHLHHKFISLGLSHKATVLILYTYNIVVVAAVVIISAMLKDINPTVIFGIAVAIAILLIQLPFILIKKPRQEQVETQV